MTINEVVETLLESGFVGTQRELAATLLDQGVVAAQPSISRALKAAGAVRRSDGKYSAGLLMADECTPIRASSDLSVGIELVHPEAKMPFRAHGDEDSGFDLFAVEKAMLFPGSVTAVSIGLKMEIPKGWEMQIQANIELAKKGVQLFYPSLILAENRVAGVLLHSVKNGVQITTGQAIAVMFLVKRAEVSFLTSPK